MPKPRPKKRLHKFNGFFHPSVNLKQQTREVLLEAVGVDPEIDPDKANGVLRAVAYVLGEYPSLVEYFKNIPTPKEAAAAIKRDILSIFLPLPFIRLISCSMRSAV